MLKKTALLVLFLITTLVTYSQNISYVIEGTVIQDSFNNKNVYLQTLSKDRNSFISVDSTTIKNGIFSFKENLSDDDKSIRFIKIETDDASKTQFVFIPENGTIKMTINDFYTLSGTSKNEEIQTFINLQDSLQNQMQLILDKYSNVVQSSDNNQKRLNELEPLKVQLQMSVYDFAKSNIDNYIGEMVAYTSYGILSAEQILGLVSMTSPEFKHSDLGKDVIAYYEAELLKEGGVSYKNIELRDKDGKEIALSDYVGKHKLVLVDFWASWCGPCIKEMPAIVELYKQYKDKGLEIVGISLDDNAQSWKKAIERLHITWPQMSDLKGWESSAAKLYGVSSIPFTMLIDKDGNIIDSYLFGDKLASKIEELLN